MEKRIFLAIVISIGVLWGWAAIAPKIFPELAKKPPVPATAKPSTATTAAETTTAPTSTTSTTTTTTTTTSAPTPAAPASIAAAAPVAPVSAQREQLTVIDMPAYRAVFTNRGAQLISFRLRNYYEKNNRTEVEMVKVRHRTRTDYPFFLETRDRATSQHLNSALYTVSDRTDRGVRTLEYRYSDGRLTATKTFQLTEQPYLFDFRVALAPAIPYRVAIGPDIRTFQDSTAVPTGNGVVEREKKLEILPREKGPLLSIFPAAEYVGIEDNYFLTVLRPSNGGEGLLRRVRFFDAKTKAHRDEFYASVNAMGDGAVAGDAFFGPKETKLLDRYGMGEALQLGWFGVIARFLLEALVWINQYTKNYGFAIIVLTIIIKILLYPLQHKQNVSMKKMQLAQPKIEALRAKYKKVKTDAEQRQKMNVEMMQLYQKEGINPMAGCLPLVLQLPILWGFYNLLSRAIELRGAPFILWIHDLSDKDPYYITPILMTATMFLQTWMMPATGDPAQRKIFLMMPLIFGFFFKDFPSGLVLYWLVQNILTIIQQLIMNKWWKDHPRDDDEDDDEKKKKK